MKTEDSVKKEAAASAVLGSRIVIHGVTGSGKSTLARRLATERQLGLIDLDAIRHARGWGSVDWPELRGILTQQLTAFSTGWVCSGNYSRVSDIVLGEADTVIWLRLPWPISFGRLLRRCFQRSWTKERLYTDQGPHETWDRTFASRDSILWWAIHHHQATNRGIARRVAALPPHVQVVELHSPAEVEQFARLNRKK